MQPYIDPTTKNVALTFAWFNESIKPEVHVYGPSSNVMAMVLGTVHPVTRVPNGRSLPPEVGWGADGVVVVGVEGCVVGWEAVGAAVPGMH